MGTLIAIALFIGLWATIHHAIKDKMRETDFTANPMWTLSFIPTLVIFFTLAYVIGRI